MKNNKIILILLVGMIVVNGTYITYQLLGRNTNVVEEKQSTYILDLVHVNRLVEQYKGIFDNGESLINNLYSKDEFQTKEFTISQKQHMVVNELKSSFSKADYEKKYKELFGSNSIVENDDILMSEGGKVLYFYNKEEEKYTFNEEAIFGVTDFVSLERDIIKVIKKDNELIVTAAVGKSEENYDNHNYHLYTLNNVDLGILYDGDMKNYYDKLDKFDHCFNYDKETNNYYLEKIVKNKN